MDRRPRKKDLDESVNPNTPYDPMTGTGKDPELSGPREDESKGAPLGHDPSNSREENPQHRADVPDDTDDRPWKARTVGEHRAT